MCRVIAASSNEVITKASQERFRENSSELRPASHAGREEMSPLYSEPVSKML